MAEHKVCVGGLPIACDENTLVTHFSNFGTVTSVDLKKDPMTGMSRGFGYVSFDSEAGVAGALAPTVQHSIGGQFVHVRQSEEQPMRVAPPGDMAAGWQAEAPMQQAQQLQLHQPFLHQTQAPQLQQQQQQPESGMLPYGASIGQGPAQVVSPPAAASSPPAAFANMGHFNSSPGAMASSHQGGSAASGGEGRVFVGGLPHGFDEAALRAFFSQFGAIAQCDYKYDQMTGLPRGFAFITFESPEVAQSVMNIGSHDVGAGKNVEVKPASEKGSKGKGKEKGGFDAWGGDPWGGGKGWDAGAAWGGYGDKGIGKGGDKGFVHEQNPRKVFVGGCPKAITEDEVRSYFSQFGDIQAIEMKYDQLTGNFRGFCFVIYETEEMAKAALGHYESHQLSGQWVEVKLAGQPPRDYAAADAVKGEKGGKDSGKGGAPGVPDVESMKIFVGGLAKVTPEEEITAYFQQFGTVTQTMLKKDDDGMSRGFAFVSFGEESAVNAVLSNYDNNQIGGKWVEVKLASSQDKGKGKGKDFGKGGFGKSDWGPWDYGKGSPYDKGGFGKGYDKGGWGKDPWSAAWAPSKGPWGKGPGKDDWSKGYGKKGFGGKDPWAASSYGGGWGAPSGPIGSSSGYGMKAGGKGGWGYAPY